MKLKRSLQYVRRLAGPVRQLDVTLKKVSKRFRSGDPKARDAYSYLIGLLSERRARAAEVLMASIDEDRRREISKRSESLVHAATERAAKKHLVSLEARARESLKAPAWLLLDTAMAGRSDAEHLHEIRRMGKKLRYRIEVFASAIAEEPTEALRTRLAELQKHLGKLNDLYEMGVLLDTEADRLSGSSTVSIADALRHASSLTTDAMDLARSDFAAWWSIGGPELLRFAWALSRGMNLDGIERVDGLAAGVLAEPFPFDASSLVSDSKKDGISISATGTEP